MLTREEIAEMTGRPLVERLVICPKLRPCNWPGCHEQTRFKRPGQHNYGTCIDHAIPEPMRMDARQLKWALMKLFPGAERIEPRDPHGPIQRVRLRSVARHVWNRWSDTLGPPFIVNVIGWPLDAGPCQMCGALVWRYGDGATQFCSACEVRRASR